MVDANQMWDVIVIGTGMGGGTFGYAMAKRGRRVLFIEQGRSPRSEPPALTGKYAESFFDSPATPSAQHADVLARSGRWQWPLEDRSGRSPRRHIPFVGAGVGGSSALYGMALERLHPDDFSPAGCFPNAHAQLPEHWPIGYDTLRPYYQQVEKLYGVRGSIDPLRGQYLDDLAAPPPMTPAAQRLSDFLLGRGLNPYRLPSACEWVDGCQGCQGFLCPRPCKNDSGRVCVTPAIDQYGAELLTECKVLKLNAQGRQVTEVICERNGEPLTLRGQRIVLAAGAIESPAILLRSRSGDWPHGLANSSDMVGRCLMRHYVDLYALTFSEPMEGLGSGIKELGFSDFYSHEGVKLGAVQSFGSLPPADVLVAGMIDDLRHDAPWIAPLVSMGRGFIRPMLARKFSRSLILASIAEDLPYLENRIELTGEGAAAMHYEIHDEGHKRIAQFRSLLRQKLRPQKVMLIKQAENNQRIAHACGTCRFGVDPKTSVLDPTNRAHDLDNLYVVDSSFFPSSGGTNPAATIAANALRVADCIE